jgi:hypothetical protein
MSCKHLQSHRCALGLHGGAPSPGVCAVCDRYDGAPRGAGDVVKNALEAAGVEAIIGLLGVSCSGCLERRIRLNERFPFTDSTNEV